MSRLIGIAALALDQFSRPFYHSHELATAKDHLRGALASTLDRRERLAIGQDWAESMRKRRPAFVEALDNIDHRRREPDYRNMAIGDCCPPGPNSTPGCTIDGRRICDYDRVGDRDSSAGNAAFSLSPQPQSSFSWWRPKLVRLAAFDSTNPSTPRWEGLFITSITVGQHPVEGFSDDPSATVTSGVHFGDFVVPDPTGVPVGWPDFSNDANANQLVIDGIGLWNANITVLTFCTVMGNPLDNRAGVDRRCNNSAPPVPPMPGGSTSVAGRSSLSAPVGYSRPL